MRLAEALIIRADYQKRIESKSGDRAKALARESRLVNAAKIQEEEAPPENPQSLAELETKSKE